MKAINQKTLFQNILPLSIKKVCGAHGPSKLGASSKDLEFIVDYHNRPKLATIKKLKRERPGSGYNPSSSVKRESNSVSFWC